MSRTLARTPLQTTQPIARKGTKAAPKHTEIYLKTVTIPLTGPNPEQLQAVAAAMHRAAAEHEFVLGGKKKRSVYIGQGPSMTPTKIFDGTIQPDRI